MVDREPKPRCRLHLVELVTQEESDSLRRRGPGTAGRTNDPDSIGPPNGQVSWMATLDGNLQHGRRQQFDAPARPATTVRSMVQLIRRPSDRSATLDSLY